MLVSTMHNAIDYSWIGKKQICNIHEIVKHDFELSMDSQERFALSLDN